jgi:hypothetical protein
MNASEMRAVLKLRSKLPGHNNRLDVQEIFTYDKLSEVRGELQGSFLPLFAKRLAPDMR